MAEAEKETKLPSEITEPKDSDKVEADLEEQQKSSSRLQKDEAKWEVHSPAEDKNSNECKHKSPAQKEDTMIELTQPTKLDISMDLSESTSNVIENVASAGKLKNQVELSWNNIDVFARDERSSIIKRLCVCRRKQEDPQIRQILFDVEGRAERGTLMAVMGSSGAGKSTLMNVLAHRNLKGLRVSGKVKVNGQTVGQDITSMSAYVQQEDLFIGTLTVREHLTFHALLKMDSIIPKKNRLQRVEEVLNQLGLRKCADTMIGISGRMLGISGGEKKRLSFASEVLTKPPLLFADEPTSGLDAFMAMSVVAKLQQLASEGHTIICSIHQPSSELYAMFDRIMLLADGRVAYIGSREGAISHFAGLGYECPVNYNPADHFVMTLSIVPGEEVICRERIKLLCDGFKRQQNTKDVEIQKEDSFQPDAELRVPSSLYNATWWTQFRTVLWRSSVSNGRDAMVSRIRIAQSILIGLIMGLVYLQTDYDQKGIQNINGALFFITTFLSFTSMQSVIFVFPVELPVFLRENKNGVYRTDVYYLCKTLAEVPIFLLTSLLLIAISYYMVGLRPDAWSFFKCFFIAVLIANTSLSFGYTISTLVDSVTSAASLAPGFMIPLFLFGGFFLKDDTVPVYFIWLKYLSWFKYGFEALVINQWSDYGTLGCPSLSNSMSAVNQTNPNDSVFCIPNGDAVIRFQGLNEDNFITDICAMIALMVGFRLVSFLLLLRRTIK